MSRITHAARTIGKMIPSEEIPWHYPKTLIANEYKILFRMLYCCGLRNSEGSTIRTECVDLDSGTLIILGSKGRKDRNVFMSDDLTELCREYYSYLSATLGSKQEWFFPGRNPNKSQG